jgi:threonylcarbamoyladenosine tRNA methylthiotransferase MtaB
MKISIITLGCKVNQYESNYLEANLVRLGCDIVKLSENPDVAIINTCTVTSKSDYQSRQFIRRATKIGCKLIVTGCYAQLNKKRILEINREAKIVDNFNKYSIIKMLTNINECYTLNYSKRARPYIKIQDGCNNYCSYCIVPYVRGKSRSIPPEDIIESITNYEKNGFNEIVLTGINLGFYGKDFNHLNLNLLLKDILLKTKIKRIRLSSLEVNNINEQLLEIMSDSRLCKHIHIPLQSGDDKILRLMNRNYTVKSFVKKIEEIKKRFNDICIGTDIIVGFPFEEEKEFLNTYNIIKRLPISYIHLFKYSPRPFTNAYNLPSNKNIHDTKRRFNMLKDLCILKRSEFYKYNIGKTVDIIVEDYISDKAIIGTSNNYLKVITCKKDIPLKSLINVKLKSIIGDVVEGDIVN